MKENIITIAKKALAIESEALVELNKYIDASFEKAVTAILNSKGRLVISGIGKSAIIAQKMVATFNSTGTPALFLHAAEAIHGDSGMIQANDIVLMMGFHLDSKQPKSPYLDFVAQTIQTTPKTQWVLVDHESKLAKPFTGLKNITCDKLQNVLQLLNH
jgi:arabinose-5-phosphate isomerase